MSIGLLYAIFCVSVIYLTTIIMCYFEIILCRFFGTLYRALHGKPENKMGI